MPAADQNGRAGCACPWRQIRSPNALPVAQALDRWQCLRQEMETFLVADANCFEVGQRRPAAQTRREPATAQGVHGHETLSKLNWVSEWHLEDARAELDPFSCRGRGGQPHEWVGHRPPGSTD